VTQTRTYPHGVPCWIDTEQPDPEAARHFYGELFGWSFEDAVPADAPGSYWIATLDGRDVAAIAPGGGDEIAWNTYIAVDDADASAVLVASQGGTIASEAADAGPDGRTATCIDPTGAAFRLWQPRARPGAQLVNAPGSWNFSDLHTDDLERAAAFYPAVFGWEAEALDLGGGATATMWRRPGYGDHLEATVDPEIRTRQSEVAAPPGFEDAIGWLQPLEAGAASSPHWHVTITVRDRDDSVAAAERLGASILSSADSDWTRSAEIRDPQGAELTLSQFTPPTG
jgi:predicted enzyme related to lactoylglutathione lyase